MNLERLPEKCIADPPPRYNFKTRGGGSTKGEGRLLHWQENELHAGSRGRSLRLLAA